MSSKIYVLDGALLECNQGFTPAKLLVTENRKVKIQGKFKATDMDVQVPATFGKCKLKPTNSGYLPCIPGLQKWTKTTKKVTLGGRKKFLYEDSECMCATGGKVTIIQPMQVNSAGNVKEEFKNLVMAIPGAMLGNDKAPKVVESYWMDEAGKERVGRISYGQKASIFVMTEHMNPGKYLKLNISEKEEKQIDGKQNRLVYSGTVKADGTAELKQLKTEEDWNKEKITSYNIGSRTRKLSLQIEAEGRFFDFSDQTLVLECKAKPTIKLHFLSFGVLLENPEESHLQAKVKTESGKAQKDENGNIILEEVIVFNPKLENFSIVHTGINPGYVYIIDENKLGEPIEFEVDENGNFKSISWEKGEEGFPDIRTVDGKNNNNGYYEAEFESVVWAAYSPIQWTKKYYDSLVSDSAKRKDRMTQIQANGFPLGTIQSSTDHAPYASITAYFSSENKNLCRSIQQKIDTIQRIEEKRQQNRNENPDHQEPEVMTDMFVTLDDPIGNANEIATVLATEIIRHRAILESIQTASDVNQIHKRMLSRGTPERLSGEKEQINAMFNLALTTYQLVYNSEDMIDDYDGGKIRRFRGIYKPKLLAVLGVEERKAQRKIVNGFRDDLGNFMSTNFYKDAYVDYLEGSVLNIIDGKHTIMQHIRLLVINPHDIDRTLDLKDEYEKNDKWDSLVEDSLKEGEDFSYKAVLNKEATVDEELIKQGIDVSNKMAAFAEASLEAYAKFALEDVVKVESNITLKKVPVQGRYKLTLNRMNTINLKTKGPDGGSVKLYEVKNKEIIQKLGDKGMKLDRSKDIFGFYGGRKKNEIIRFKTNTPEIILVDSKRGNHIFDIPVIEEVEREIVNYTETTTKQPTKLAKRVVGFVNGTPFRRVVALLQVFNITAAYDSFSDQESGKNGVALAGVSFELLAASAYFSKSLLANQLSGSSSKLISRLAFGAEIAGMGVTVIVCGWEAIESYGRRDQDAMWAWVGASAAFSVATAATIMGSSSVLGPFGWIAAGIGVGLVILAYYLKDSPLEAYFKHFAFSDEKALDKNPGELTWRYNQRFYDNRLQLMGDSDNEYQRYTDFKLAAAELTDLIVCADIRLTPGKVVNQTKDYIQSYSRHIVGTTIKEGDIKEFTATISFRQFFTDPSQLSYEVYYYQEGVLKGGGIKLDINASVTRKKGTKEKPPQAIINFEIPDQYLVGDNKKSQVLVVCYLDIGQGKYYPNRYNTAERYIGVIAGVNQLKSETIGNMGITKMNHTYHSNARVNTLESLKSGNAWKK
ncbi:PAAR-like protein [Ascidiimonas sp. W6]|uniref:PAAR-like protein n=1 Tax=Ascidiimonas meishanensis TaxID=3128903 RepID=UPI0030EB210E